jgi:hypothetical protein
MKKYQSIFGVCMAVILLTGCQLPFGEKPPCGQSVLQVGERTYQIKEIETRADGTLNVPGNKVGIAYWVNQTATNQVFALSPTPENLALQTTNPEQATVTWANCNSSTYTLAAAQAGVPDMTTLLDQSFSGITIYVEQDGSGFVIRGEFMGEEIQAFDTPDPNSIQAEISLLETIPAADRSTLTVSVSITNVGQAGITLTTNDVALLLNETRSQPSQSDPALPKEIAPGATETFHFTFDYPAAPGATLHVLTVEYELEGY